GNGEWGVGSRESGVGNGEWGVGSRELGVGSWESGMGDEDLVILRSCTNVIKPIKAGFLAIASMENQGFWSVIENGARSQ
ncbi:MAG TPA: hypothetical protein DC064_05735, partial [Cyanobacteria bacterium UBA9273]|nr:hypothetical protein [Cyanobacteria bacterium UBA9273]